jgi:2-polyprenyl-3-methyl-5-hydroxy-6-metoxy-1,4-benzoquinol methylase
MHTFAPIREELVETAIIPCRLCGSAKYKKLFSADNLRRKAKRFFDVVRCEDCGYSYFNPSPTEESLKYYYEDYMAHVHEKPGVLERLYYHFFRGVPGIRPPGKLLDVGCGNGKYLDVMRSKGWKVVGVDQGPGCTFAKNELKLEVYDGHLWDFHFEDNSFDVVTLWFVIEHIWDPIKLLTECNRILKPGGVIILSTLNSASFESRVFKRYWWHLLSPEHVSQFDPHSLTVLAEKTGFKATRMRHEILCFGILGSIQNVLDGKKIPISINNLFFKLLFAPLDMLCGLLRQSGLITLYAVKK